MTHTWALWQLLKRKLPLNFEPEESIQRWIATLPSMSDKDLYSASLLKEPRGAAPETIK